MYKKHLYFYNILMKIILIYMIKKLIKLLKNILMDIKFNYVI